MESNKKLSVLDIVNICVLGAGLVLIVVSFFIKGEDIPGFNALFTIIAVAGAIALIAGIVYMLCRYQKKGAIAYKVFMYACVVMNAIMVLGVSTIGTQDLLLSICNVLVLILSSMLASAKDYGKIRSFIVAGLLLIVALVIFVKSISLGLLNLFIIALLILVLETGIMVIGKYQDKAARGTK